MFYHKVKRNKKKFYSNHRASLPTNLSLKRSLGGFSLLEVGIVIIIIGILAGIAFPRYNMYVEDSRITEATHMLGAIRDAQMRYVTENDDYASVLGNLDLNISAQRRYFDFEVFSPYPFDTDIEEIARATRNTEDCCGGYEEDYYIDIYEDGTFETGGCSDPRRCPQTQ